MTKRKESETEVPDELRNDLASEARPSAIDGSSLGRSVAQEVRRAIAGIAYPVARRLRWELNDGILVLEGVVHSYYLKQVIWSAVRSIDGVRRIVDRVEVRPGTAEDPAPGA